MSENKQKTGSFRRNRSRKAITLDQLMLRATDAINEAERIIREAETDGQRTNAINALSGLISRYAKLYETYDLEKRIEEIENRLNDNGDK